MLAFPSNDFRQETRTDAEIADFVTSQYPGADFPLFAKGPLGTNPVYRRLGEHLLGRRVKGNFFKYLVDRRGIARDLYTKKENPLSFEERIVQLLEEKV